MNDVEIETLQAPVYLIEPYVVQGSFAMLFGEPGSGKSFLALEWAFATATGQATLGKTRLTGPVVFIVGEGLGGISKRVRAWKAARKFEGGAGVFFWRTAVNFLDKPAMDAFIATVCKLPRPPVLIVIDTVARCLPGADENSAKDMGLFVAAADRLRRETGAAVLAVHHSGWAGQRERGSSALRAAVDTALQLTRKGTLHRLLCEKQKDAEACPGVTFGLQTVALPDGESSCVVDPGAVPAPSVSRTPVSKAPRETLTALSGLHKGRATSQEWREATKLPPRTFHNHLASLVKGGLVTKEGTGRLTEYALTDDGRCHCQGAAK